MANIDKYAITAGIVLVIIGLCLLIASLFIWIFVIYGLIALILGIVILLTLRQQEYIEPIKKEKKKV